VSLSQIRAILKKLRLSKYYERTSFIMSQLGKPTKPFDHALEEHKEDVRPDPAAFVVCNTIARISCQLRPPQVLRAARARRVLGSLPSQVEGQAARSGQNLAQHLHGAELGVHPSI
jgi:hypothetical protein